MRRWQAATTRDGGQIGQLLGQLVAASAHIIVPVAAFNLKARAGTTRQPLLHAEWIAEGHYWTMSSMLGRLDSLQGNAPQPVLHSSTSCVVEAHCASLCWEVIS